jgi:hypothetical protein
MVEAKAKRKWNKAWKDDTRNERTRNREQALTAKLVAAGWAGKSDLLTAIINGTITVPPKPVGAAQAAQEGSNE